MPSLTIYKLRSRLDGQTVKGLAEYVDVAGKTVSTYGPVQGPGFEAILYVSDVPPHAPRWGTLLREGFGEDVKIPSISSAGALLLLAVDFKDGPRHFALPFGTNGRFLLRQAAPEIAFGVRTALNLIYPSGTPPESGSRLIGVDSKRHGLETVRSRLQSSRATAPETFDLDVLRDMLNAATGRPIDQERWGPRVHGGDGLSCSPDVEFNGLGKFCQDLESVHLKIDYRTRFPWFDYIKPVADPETVGELDEFVLQLLKEGETQEFDLAPPQIVDWEEVTEFRYTSERKRGIRHPEMRLMDLMGTLKAELEELTIRRLGSIQIRALNADGRRVHNWTAWKCLSGSFVLGDMTYVLDEGSYYVVTRSFLEEMDAFLDAIPVGPSLPDYTVDLKDEGAYNAVVAESIEGSMMLHLRFIPSPQRGSRVELCDILTPDGDLIHVKREFGSRDLNHLFSQGANSAEMLQEVDFRGEVRPVILELDSNSGLEHLFPDEGFSPSQFNVCFAVAADWKERSLSESLPFFAKLALRRAFRDLRNRGFNVSWTMVNGPAKAVQKK